ncbi:LOW QUALITY PROTEIN: ubiquitin carboxyl-terminal hydrolase 3 [Culex quinquefasciatus]|uniref:LOW QUALITY PROTEIN: ubiquitin carboxyl-terminal hydrolase 3 n=1 Tax=Culex quinquefasciatus TaxID=7176 RepID=UPI0018E3E30E|nr:LOW QUALITY PROTEIN: ubiquitin carboxyl-terminal hydrolase 3 [Culex quinquefasciatus]
MDCPHIGDNVVLRKDAVRNMKLTLVGGQPATSETPAASTTAVTSSSSSPASFSKLWKCAECSGKDNWMCLQCGSVRCGRYEQGHALKHSSQRNHSICINTVNLSVYCYKCDEFVVNDTADNVLEEIRGELKDGDCDTVSETSSTMEEISSSKSGGGGQENASSTSSSSDSGWEEPSSASSAVSSTSSHSGAALSAVTLITPVRKLRPRKRTISSDSNNENGAVANGGNGASNSSSSQAKRKSMRRVVGLRNLGNTCFMNSVLQSLSNIQEFSCYFNAMPSLETGKHKQKAYHSRSMKENLDDVFVVEELRKVLLNLSQGGDGSKGAISPECLFLVIWKVVPQFRGHRQHDAHEFLRYMLDRLHTELQQVSFPVDGSLAGGGAGGGGHKPGEGKPNPYNVPALSHLHTKGRNSIVTNVFGGILQSEVRCLICGMESKKHDPFLDLSLDIPEKYYTKESAVDGGDKDKDAPVCHISDCLSSFTEVEELAETELYYCNSCKCKQKSTKRFWIRRLPNVLCLHIKRFRWNNFYRTKIDLRISFPINALDMSQFVLNNGPETRRSNSSCNVYDLAAVIVHHGNGSSCGHYTSFAINNGVWMHFNDHTVKEVSSAAVADCKPYILFYIKRDPTNASRVGGQAS